MTRFDAYSVEELVLRGGVSRRVELAVNKGVAIGGDWWCGGGGMVS